MHRWFYIYYLLLHLAQCCSAVQSWHDSLWHSYDISCVLWFAFWVGSRLGWILGHCYSALYRKVGGAWKNYIGRSNTWKELQFLLLQPISLLKKKLSLKRVCCIQYASNKARFFKICTKTPFYILSANNSSENISRSVFTSYASKTFMNLVLK